MKILASAAGLLRRLLALEWLAVLAAAPLLTFPTVRPHWTVAALVVLAAWWLLRWLVRREPWPLTPFNGALLLFALMLPVGIGVSVTPEITCPEAMRVLLGLAVFRTVLAMRDRRTLAWGTALFCLLGTAITVVGLLGIQQWSAKVDPLGELVGKIPQLFPSLPEDEGTPGVNPNHLAGALSFYVPLSFALMMGWPFRRRVVWFSFPVLFSLTAFLVLIAGALLLAQSRSGWVGGLVGLCAVIVLGGLTAHRRWMRVSGIVLLVVLIFALLFWLRRIGPDPFLRTVYEPGDQSEMETVVGPLRVDDRLEIWDRALDAIRDFPFTGCGLGSFRHVVWVFYPLFRHPLETYIGHAHNIFLQTALDLGIPGLIAYLALLMVAGAVCWRVARRGDPLTRPLAIGLAAGLLALHTYGMTDALALGSKPAVVFWFALGLIAAMEKTYYATRITQ